MRAMIIGLLVIAFWAALAIWFLTISPWLALAFVGLLGFILLLRMSPHATFFVIGMFFGFRR